MIHSTSSTHLLSKTVFNGWVTKSEDAVWLIDFATSVDLPLLTDLCKRLGVIRKTVPYQYLAYHGGYDRDMYLYIYICPSAPNTL